MSASRKNSNRSNSRRTKDQILQELEVTQRLLIEKEEELVICQEELAHLIQDDNVEPAQASEELVRLEELEALETENNRLKIEIENSNAALLEAEARADALKASLEEQETILADLADTETQEAEIARLEKSLADSENALQEAEGRIKTLTESLEKKEAEFAETTETTLIEEKVSRLETALTESNRALEKSEKQIEELNTILAGRKQEPPKSLDLPVRSESAVDPNWDRQDESAEDPDTADVLQSFSSKPGETVLKKPEPVTTVPIKIAPFVEIIHQNEPFMASISIDLTRISSTNPPGLHCNTKLFAKRLSDGWSEQIGEATNFYEGLNVTTAEMRELILPAGFYHLQAVASFKSVDGTPVPIAAIHEGEILQVVA